LNVASSARSIFFVNPGESVVNNQEPVTEFHPFVCIIIVESMQLVEVGKA
jgi:hypothetical protein